MEPWVEKLIYALVSVIIPVGIILANAVLGFGGILLIIGLTVWIGASLIILSPLLE